MASSRLIGGFAKSITGELAAIAKARPDLSNISSIEITLSPWNHNSISTKEVWRKLNDEKCRKTNRFCSFKTTVEHQLDDPLIAVTFTDGEKLHLIGTYLKTSEMMYYFNSFCKKKEQAAPDTPKVLF